MSVTLRKSMSAAQYRANRDERKAAAERAMIRESLRSLREDFNALNLVHSNG